jgi:protein-S-isoprenylcysteine O-methyltransferase Ste14
MAGSRRTLFALHGLFYAVFVPRALLRWGLPVWRAATGNQPAAAAAVQGNALPRRSAPAPGALTSTEARPGAGAGAGAAAAGDASSQAAHWVPLALHGVAMGLLYLSILRARGPQPERRRSASPAAGSAARERERKGTADREQSAPSQGASGSGRGHAAIHQTADSGHRDAEWRAASAWRLRAVRREENGGRLVILRQAAGGATVLASAGLAAWTLAVFRSWRLLPRIEHQHELCTAGPFRWVRHPIYLAMDLLAAGTWLWLPTAPVAASAVLVAVAGDVRGRGEERQLAAAFGSAYDRYRRRVRRFVPGLY